MFEKIINENVDYICYPCGDYNEDTVKIVTELNIKYGFISYPNKNESRFSLGRVDCIDVLKNLNV